MAASSEKQLSKSSGPLLEAPGYWRLRVYKKMCKEERCCQRFSVWWKKKNEESKWADGRVRLRSGPRRRGERSRAGIQTRKIQRKKDIRMPEAWNCSQHFFFFFFFPLAAPKQRAKSVLEHLHNRNVEIFLQPWVKYERKTVQLRESAELTASIPQIPSSF